MKNLNNKTVKESMLHNILIKSMETNVKVDKTASVLENTDLINSAKTDFAMKKELLHQLTSEVNYKLKGDAWADIKRIVKMYTHIGKSKLVYNLDIPQLDNYGFPAGTVHLEEYQKQKMTAQELKDKPWRYTDKNSKSLEKQLAMCKYYYANVDHLDLNLVMPKEHLMELVCIASRFMD